MDRLDEFERRLLELEKQHKREHPELYPDEPEPPKPTDPTKGKKSDIVRDLETIKPR